MTDTGPRDVSLDFGRGPVTVRLGGYRPDVGGAAAEVVTDRTVETLPQTVDLRPDCTRVEDQKDIGSCTACVAVGSLEYHRKKRRIDPSDLSKLFVYYNTRKLRGDIETDSGATMAETMAAVLAHGAARSDLWPYVGKQDGRWKEEPPKEAYAEAQLNEAVQFARVSPGAGVLGTLAAGYPVSVMFLLPDTAWAMAGQTGVMPELTEAQWAGPTSGGHAVLAVGYDLLRRQYLVRNSWGADWGEGGYAWVPFSVMERGAHGQSFWVIGQLEQDGGMTLRQPEGESATDKLRAGIRDGLQSGLSDVRKGLRDRLTRR